MRNGIIAILSLLSLAYCNNGSLQGEASAPNILWILAEDLSPDLGCYGNALVHTPNVDSLARRGVRFTQAFVTAPACTPSRTALATGMYQTAIDAHHMRYPEELRNPLPEPVLPINELMRRQGYQTANIEDNPGTGKDDWSFRSPVADYDVRHWDSLSAEKPFFAVVNLRLTHRPFERDTIRPVDPAQVELPPYYPDHPVARRDWSHYLETVQIMDRQVGQVLEELEQRGYADNTIVFFFSDHGRPMSRAKNYHFDSGIQIPLIIHSPEGVDWRQFLPPGITDDRLVSAIDLTATTLAMAGADKPTWMQGRVLLGPDTDPERDFIFCASDRMGETFFKTRSVRNEQYKYIRNFNRNFSVNSSATAYRRANHPIYHLLNIYQEKGWLKPAQQALVEPVPEELLFDLKADPFETNNLAGDPAYQSLLDEMRSALKIWQTETTDHGMKPDSAELQEAFANYGKQSAERYAERIQALGKRVRNAVEGNEEGI